MAELQVRNVAFSWDAALPRYWHGGRKAVTLFFDNLSVFFPEGERFFMESVRAFRSRITAPQLGAAVIAFCAQEALHTREHLAYNQMLAQHGYPVAQMEARVRRLLRHSRKHLPRRWQLAATAALEHFTALMGDIVLRDPAILAGAHPRMAALWRWHAAEENEHKSVAFDVYRASGGNEAERCFIMLWTSLIFWAKVLEQQWRMMRADGIQWSVAEWLDLWVFLFLTPGGMVRVGGEYMKYYRRGFHPAQIESQGLVEAWKREYATSPQYHPRRKPS
jgi:uncharacterized protein